MKKFELTAETKFAFGRTLHRIKALVSFSDVKSGDLGGWIEQESNLAHDGNAWVYGDAWVCGDARVCGDAQVCGNAQVCDNAQVCGDAQVYGNAWVCGDARVCDNARVYGDAQVYGDALVYDDARVYGNAQVCDNAQVCGDAQVYGNAQVYGDAWVCGDGTIFWIGAIGSRNGTTTFFKCTDNKIRVVCGCFFGDLDEFAAAVKKTHGDNQHAKVYQLAIQMAKERIGAEEQ